MDEGRKTCAGKRNAQGGEKRWLGTRGTIVGGGDIHEPGEGGMFVRRFLKKERQKIRSRRREESGPGDRLGAVETA